VDPAETSEIAAIVLQQLPIPWLPRYILAGETLTIRLVSELPDGADGISSPSSRLIRLPASALSWDDQRLRRVLRHEITHVALTAFWNDRRSPLWLEEGLASWQDGLNCKAEARVRLDVIGRIRDGRAMPTLVGLRTLPTVIDNYYYGLFIRFLDERGNGDVSNGSLAAAIKERGIRAGFTEVFGTVLTELEAEWQEHLRIQFGQEGKGLSCE